jgi:hypothetical protein
MFKNAFKSLALISTLEIIFEAWAALCVVLMPFVIMIAVWATI